MPLSQLNKAFLLLYSTRRSDRAVECIVISFKVFKIVCIKSFDKGNYCWRNLKMYGADLKSDIIIE